MDDNRMEEDRIIKVKGENTPALFSRPSKSETRRSYPYNQTIKQENKKQKKKKEKKKKPHHQPPRYAH